MTLTTYVGHAPDHVRAAFMAAIEDPIEISSAVDIGDPYEPIEELCIQLSLCTDPLPADLCEKWDLPQGSAFKDAAAVVLKRIRG
jgi:hypothetical protein